MKDHVMNPTPFAPAAGADTIAEMLCSVGGCEYALLGEFDDNGLVKHSLCHLHTAVSVGHVDVWGRLAGTFTAERIALPIIGELRSSTGASANVPKVCVLWPDGLVTIAESCERLGAPVLNGFELFDGEMPFGVSVDMRDERVVVAWTRLSPTPGPIFQLVMEAFSLKGVVCRRAGRTCVPLRDVPHRISVLGPSVLVSLGELETTYVSSLAHYRIGCGSLRRQDRIDPSLMLWIGHDEGVFWVGGVGSVSDLSVRVGTVCVVDGREYGVSWNRLGVPSGVLGRCFQRVLGRWLCLTPDGQQVVLQADPAS